MKHSRHIFGGLGLALTLVTLACVIRGTSKSQNDGTCAKPQEKATSTSTPVKASAQTDLLHQLLLEEDAIPGWGATAGGRTPGSAATVHYFWCKDGIFTFENYISVMSVVKTVNPYKIVFHYTSLPRTDAHEYFFWFQDVQAIPYLVMKRLDAHHPCRDSPVTKLQTVTAHLRQHGGVYVGEETIITQEWFQLQLQQQLLLLLPDQQQLFHIISNTSHSQNIIKDLNGVISLQAGNQSESLPNNETERSPHCCVLKDLQSRVEGCACIVPVLDHILYPKYTWEVDSEFGRLIRNLAYGHENQLVPKQNYSDLAPRLSHYIWYGKRQFDFSHYLSVLSAIYVAGFGKVFFHGDIEPYGEYWDKITAEEDVTYIYMEMPESVFNNTVTQPAHASDIMKMYILYQYGGVHQDPDVYWLNYVSDEELAYDSMMGFEWLQAGHWPETFNIGVFMAKKHSKYIKEFVKTYRDFRDDEWIFNSALLTYRTYERNPTVLFADRHLQVLCFLYRCHPPWLSDYNVYDLSPDAPGFDFDWMNEALTIHNTVPKPYKELSRMDFLMNSTSVFADIGRFILVSSGRLQSRR